MGWECGSTLRVDIPWYSSSKLSAIQRNMALSKTLYTSWTCKHEHATVDKLVFNTAFSSKFGRMTYTGAYANMVCNLCLYMKIYIYVFCVCVCIPKYKQYTAIILILEIVLVHTYLLKSSQIYVDIQNHTPSVNRDRNFNQPQTTKEHRMCEETSRTSGGWTCCAFSQQETMRARNNTHGSMFWES